MGNKSTHEEEDVKETKFDEPQPSMDIEVPTKDIFNEFCLQVPEDVQISLFSSLDVVDYVCLIFITSKTNKEKDSEKVWQNWSCKRLGWDLPQVKMLCLAKTWKQLFRLLWELRPSFENNVPCSLPQSKQQKLLKFFEKESKEGNKDAHFHIGLFHEHGYLGCPYDAKGKKALEYFMLGAAGGEIDAMAHIGMIHERNTDYKLANEWYLKVSAHEDGDSEADNSLGWAYENSLGVTQDYKKAMFYFEKSAKKGNAKAATNIGWLYHNGWGIRQDFKKAMHYYEIGWNGGNLIAATNIAWIYADGLGDYPVDYNKAFYYYKVAADGKNGYGENGVAWCYHLGYGVEKNLKAAEKYYRLAIEHGLTARAQPNLNILLQEIAREKKKKNETKKK